MAFWGGGYGGGALQCIVWLWMWMWFWGICIPNSYGSGTTRARGAPHGDGREGVFGTLTALRRSFGAPVSVSSARDRQRRSATSRTEMPRRTRGSLRPLRFARALVFDCAASLRKLRFTTAHFASRATPSRPSRSSAWFKGGETPPCELRA